MVDYSNYPNFINNLKALESGGAIPPTDPGHVGKHVCEAIDALKPEEIKVLCDIAVKAQGHLFVHDKNNNVVAMGL